MQRLDILLLTSRVRANLSASVPAAPLPAAAPDGLSSAENKKSPF